MSSFTPATTLGGAALLITAVGILTSFELQLQTGPGVTAGVKTLALVASSFFAGTNAAFSFLWIESIKMASNDKELAALWRSGYIIGYKSTSPKVIIATISWLVLAFEAPAASPQRVGYLAAALPFPSILLFTWTVQRAVNGALCHRAEKLIGPGPGYVCETYSKDEEASVKYAAKKMLRELVDTWKLCNWVRTGMLVSGAVPARVAGVKVSAIGAERADSRWRVGLESALEASGR